MTHNSSPLDPYDLTHFYLKSKDEKGHGEKMQTRVPSEISRMCDKLISRRVFPYLETTSDLVRDAIFREVLLLSEHQDDTKIHGMASALIAANQVIEDEIARSKIMELAENTQVLFMKTPDDEHRKQVASEVIKQLSSTESDYWNKQALKELHNKLPSYF